MTLRAILLMILSMSLLAWSDVFYKLATQGSSIGQAMTLVALGGTVLFVLLSVVMKVRILTRDALHPMILLRNGFEIIGAIGLVTGLAYVSLPVFAAIMQTGPLTVTIGAAIFLKEDVGPRRWAAVGVGILGMLIVIRPWSASFTGYELFAVLGIVGLSGRDLVTRLSPSHIPALAISTWGFAFTIPAGCVLWFLSDTPTDWSAPTLWSVLGAVIVTASGYLAITTAMRLAPAAIVAPFRYTRLVFTPALGILIFGDRPDALTYVGAGIILVAGLYTFFRERALAQSVAPVGTAAPSPARKVS
ncbi:drug/metabolite transporter (DMT)-like permease [Sagittula marina]|uniref:Drug/metabolite transporter (DMT)-like permease n=1 Tax=Sagittula marina TaxID=943940 RepID=A0A7W6DSX0_9RHOB|nr:DMT family transporter [Sagittula marina]MBB3985468.1 drug/metabolite transporter (DMT)-like permease [Sagittula marina]